MEPSMHHHPCSLRVFFTTEMWERYGFYVVQSLLALYMAIHFSWPDDRTYALVGSFTALTYLSPVVGGYIADKLLGQKRSILLGAVFLFFSYLSLAFLKTDHGLTISLAGITVGTGLLKPNISSLLGNEYPLDSPKRESGFTIFYMGITTGIILGTTLPNQLQHHFGWSFAFLSAAIGMVIAFLVFSLGVKRYRIADYRPHPFLFRNLLISLGIISVLGYVAYSVLTNVHFANKIFTFVVLASLGFLLLSMMHESKEQAKKTAVIGLLCCISVVFWSFYFQMFLSLTLFLARIAEGTWLGIPFPPPYYVTIQSIGMLLFGYILSRPFFTSKHLATGTKFLLSMSCMCLAYGLIALVATYTENSSLLSPLLFIPAYLLISIAELLLSPVGLSAITTLASKHKVSTMMGIFFISLGLGAFLSGKLALLTAVPNAHIPLIELKLHYAHAFSILLCILVTATLICVILNGIIRKLLHH